MKSNVDAAAPHQTATVIAFIENKLHEKLEIKNNWVRKRTRKTESEREEKFHGQKNFIETQGCPVAREAREGDPRLKLNVLFVVFAASKPDESDLRALGPECDGNR